MPRSSLAWLDFHPDDLRRARDFVHGLQGEGVLDELGFGTLYSAIANHLYPATNTIMTRARYLFFVPAIYVYLQRRRTRRGEIASQARRMQDALRETLALNEPRGVIGSDAKAEVKRLPSNIYWNSLRELGVFTRPTSEASYQDQFDTLRAGAAFEDDDKVAHVGTELETCWDQHVPISDLLNPDGTFPGDTSFALARDEAKDLRRRYRERHEGSLLTHLIEVGAVGVPRPWLAPSLPPALAALLEHARALSAVARGAVLLYHQMLVERKAELGLSGEKPDVGEAFRDWWDGARRILLAWDPGACFRHPTIRLGLRRGDSEFLTRWRSLFVEAANADVLLVSTEARRLVQVRELAKRPYKARLKFQKYLEQWEAPGFYRSGDENLYALDYRHRIGQQFAADAVKGLRP